MGNLASGAIAAYANNWLLDDLSVKIAESDEDRNRIFEYRYALYIKTLSRSSTGANDSRKILRESFDDRSILLYAETPESKLTGTVSLLRGPFEREVEQRIQMERITEIDPSIDVNRFFYLSKFMTSTDHRNRSVGGDLLLAAFLHSAKLGGAVGFIHCAESMKRYFIKWGCKEYGVPFSFENVGVQYPLAISTTFEKSHAAVQSPVMSSGYVFPNDPEASLFFQNLTGYIDR